MRLLFFWIILALLPGDTWGQVSPAPAMGELVIRIPAQSRGDPAVDDYVFGLLHAALSASLSPGQSLTLVRAERPSSQNRTMTDLMRGHQLDLMWTMTTREREQQLRPVRIPLFRGLLGYRVLLIKQGQQAAFDSVKSLSQLAALRAGQDPQWPDRVILERAGLTVIPGPYSQLFAMLRNGRIDYFPRGMNEVLPELAGEQGLALEAGLLLVYPAPMYFFVHPDNRALAARLESGLMQMVEDGSYQRYFNEHPLIESTLTSMNLDDRVVIPIKNVLLPNETPLADGRLWLIDMTADLYDSAD